jgi:hypothetical protein
MAKKSLSSVLQSLEVGEDIKVNYGYMTVAVTISREKKKYGNADKKYVVKEAGEKICIIKRLK